VEEESTRYSDGGLRESDRKPRLVLRPIQRPGSHFFVTVKEGEKVDKHRLTQVGRAMKELGIQDDCGVFVPGAGSVGAQLWNLAGPLAQELRLAGISTVEGANAFLRDKYIAEFNTKVQCARRGEGHRISAHHSERPELDLTVQTERVVEKDNTVAIRDRWWQIDKTRFRKQPGGKHGNDPRTPGWNRRDPLRPSCCRTL